jgi:hypothetical protein
MMGDAKVQGKSCTCTLCNWQAVVESFAQSVSRGNVVSLQKSAAGQQTSASG